MHHDDSNPSLFHSSRRDFLRASAAVSGILGGGAQAASMVVEATADDFVRLSQPRPEPRIVLPTDSLPTPSGPRKKIAAITTSYFKYSHADDIITKFLEGYAVFGRTHLPHCEVVSLFVEQTPETDIGRGMAARYHARWCNSPAEALTLGGDALAVDGVLLVAEHGEYPFNAKGQQLYPRRRLFEQIVKVFDHSGRAAPVYNDKHFSYSWSDAVWMREQSRRLGFPMMAGSSVPVAWRRPALAFRNGIKLKAALAVGFSGLEVYGFHTLELLQAFVEKRAGGEVGIQAVQCLAGDAAWDAAGSGRWRPDLLSEAVRHIPGVPPWPLGIGLAQLRTLDPEAIVFLVDYADGFTSSAYLSRKLVNEFAFAAEVEGRPSPVGTWAELNKPQRDHFSFLCNHIEVMFRSGKPSYPVERTYLVTGALAALVDSHAQNGRRIETPHLARVGYTPAEEWTTAS